MGKEYKHLRRHKVKRVQANSQEDSSFPADDHQDFLNKINKTSEYWQWTQQKCRLGKVSNKLMGRVAERGGLKRISRVHNPRPSKLHVLTGTWYCQMA